MTESIHIEPLCINKFWQKIGHNRKLVPYLNLSNLSNLVGQQIGHFFKFLYLSYTFTRICSEELFQKDKILDTFSHTRETIEHLKNFSSTQTDLKYFMSK